METITEQEPRFNFNMGCLINYVRKNNNNVFYQENPGPDLNLAQHNLQSSHLAGPGVLGPGPSQPHPTQPIPVMNQNQVLGGVVQPSLPGLGGAGPPPLPLSNHIPQNGLVQAVQQVFNFLFFISSKLHYNCIFQMFWKLTRNLLSTEFRLNLPPRCYTS